MIQPQLLPNYPCNEPERYPFHQLQEFYPGEKRSNLTCTNEESQQNSEYQKRGFPSISNLTEYDLQWENSVIQALESLETFSEDAIPDESTK
jgi:hypothetical protein